MGKGRRNGRSRYRIVVMTKEQLKRKRELEQRKKEMRSGDIYAGEMKVMPLITGGIVSKEFADKLERNLEQERTEVEYPK